MRIFRNRIAEARGSVQQGALEKQLKKLGFKGDLNQVELGIQVPDKNNALIIAKYFQFFDETIEQVLLRLFDRVDYDYLFRNKVAEMRLSAEKSRSDLATELGMKEKELADIEHGRTYPTPELLRSIMEAFRTSNQDIWSPYPDLPRFK